MSLLSRVFLPVLERELMAQEPALAKFFIQQLDKLGHELIAYTTEKIDKKFVDLPPNCS